MTWCGVLQYRVSQVFHDGMSLSGCL
jgi:hypothetical protein